MPGALYWLRWLAVLPVAVIALVLSGVAVWLFVALAKTLLTSEDFKLLPRIIYDLPQETLEFYGRAVFGTFIFVYAGAWTAPRHRWPTALALGILLLALTLVTFALDVANGLSRYGSTPNEQLLSLMLSLAGGVLGVAAVRRWLTRQSRPRDARAALAEVRILKAPLALTLAERTLLSSFLPTVNLCRRIDRWSTQGLAVYVEQPGEWQLTDTAAATPMRVTTQELDAMANVSGLASLVERVRAAARRGWILIEEPPAATPVVLAEPEKKRRTLSTLPRAARRGVRWMLTHKRQTLLALPVVLVIAVISLPGLLPIALFALVIVPALGISYVVGKFLPPRRAFFFLLGLAAVSLLFGFVGDGPANLPSAKDIYGVLKVSAVPFGFLLILAAIYASDPSAL